MLYISTGFHLTHATPSPSSLGVMHMTLAVADVPLHLWSCKRWFTVSWEKTGWEVEFSWEQNAWQKSCDGWWPRFFLTNCATSNTIVKWFKCLLFQKFAMEAMARLIRWFTVKQSGVFQHTRAYLRRLLPFVLEDWEHESSIEMLHTLLIHKTSLGYLCDRGL